MTGTKFATNSNQVFLKGLGHRDQETDAGLSKKKQQLQLKRGVSWNKAVTKTYN